MSTEEIINEELKSLPNYYVSISSDILAISMSYQVNFCFSLKWCRIMEIGCQILPRLVFKIE